MTIAADPNSETTTPRSQRPWLFDVVLLAWFACHLAWWVRPVLLYQAGRPVFSLAPEFAAPFWRECGGLARYVGLWLAQFDAFGWPGVLIRVGEAAALGWLCQAVVVAAGARRSDWQRWLPMACFMLLSGRYDQWPGTAPALLGLLALTRLGQRLPERFGLVGSALLAAVATYTCAGAVDSVHLVMGLCGMGLVWAVGSGRASRVTAPVLLSLLAVAYAPARATLGSLTAPSLTSSWRDLLTLALFAVVPLSLLSRRWAGLAPGRITPRVRSLVTAGAGLLVCALAVGPADDAAGRDAADRDYCLTHGLWDRLLALGPGSPTSPRALLDCHDFDLALYQRGRLADDLFRYRQMPSALLLPFSDRAPLAYRWRCGDQYLRLGRLNLAEHLLLDALPAAPGDPLLLRQLAYVYLVKGDLPTARLYLNRLTYDIAQRGWARHNLDLAERDPELSSDAQIVSLRANRLTREDVLEVYDRSDDGSKLSWPRLPDRMLVSLMRSNRHNRMAYEYLVSLYLLTAQPQVAAQLMRYLPEFGVSRIPAGWEEGVAMVLAMPGAKADLGALSVSAEARGRFAEFDKLLTRHGGDPRAAYADVARAFPASYYLYLVGARSGR